MKYAFKMMVVMFLTFNFILCFTIVNLQPSFSSTLDIITSAKQAIIYDHEADQVLFEKNADQLIKPASMAKVMTAYIVFDRIKDKSLNMSDTFIVSDKAWRMGGSRSFLELNNNVTVKDLLLGLIVQSGNDAAVVLAEGISGDEEAFAREMNRYAKTLGMKDTYFTNSTGWPHPDLQTTSRDLVILTKRIIDDFPELYKLFEEKIFTYNKIKQSNRNPLLYIMNGADGLKTGHTNESGYGLIGSVKRNDRRVTIVINGLNSKKKRRFESKRLLLIAFREQSLNATVASKKKLPICPTSPTKIKHNCYGIDVNIYRTIKYEGEYQNNKRHGYGILTIKNGEKYSGEWKNGKKHGKGEETWANGEKYIGNFENGNFISNKKPIKVGTSISSAELEQEKQKRLALQKKANEEERKRRELERKVAALEAKKKQEHVKIYNDKEKPVIKSSYTFIGANAKIIGIVTDNVELVEILVDGEQIPFSKNGAFETELYVPRNGLNVEIIAYDKKGNKSTKILNLQRDAIVQASGPTFERLNPSSKRVKPNPNALALIIGVADYEKTNADALYADKDAQQFYDYAMMKLGIPSSNIRELINDKADESEILLSIKEWLRRSAKPNKSDIYIFFAGHGLASQDGKNMYLLPHDGSPRLLDDTAILRDRLFSDLKATNPKSVTVFLDTCYSGVTRNEEMLIAGRPIVIKAKEQAIPDGFTLFSAASNEQISRPLEEAKHGMFSYFLMKGMEGDADTNSDNKITARELHAYVKQNVVQQSSGSQTPELQGDKDRVLVQFN